MKKNLNLIKKVSEETKCQEEIWLMQWTEIVDKIILPKMIGSKENRWASDQYMNFVANNARAIYQTNEHIAGIMFEIALQRLSCGAVLHDATPWPEPLPEKYWEYSSAGDEPHLMTEGCFHFLVNAMQQCVNCEMTRSHALKILFGVLQHIEPNGAIGSDYLLPDKFKSRAAELYSIAKKLAEKMASFDEIYQNYARPGQWYKHKEWFADHCKQIKWNKFFKDTKCLKGNFFQRLQQRCKIKREIKKLTSPFA